MPSVNKFGIPLRWILTVLLCLTVFPHNLVQAHPFEKANHQQVCSPAWVENQFNSLALAEVPQPNSAVEIDFGSGFQSAEAVQGLVAPDTDVAIAASSWTINTHSDASGYYRVELGGYDCATNTLRKITGGTTVWVTAGGQTYQTVARWLNGRLDPIANTVTGDTNAGAVVEISLSEPFPSAGCEDPEQRVFAATATAQINRRYFAELGDFGGRAVAEMRIHDDQGSSFIHVSSPSISLDLDTGFLYGPVLVNATINYTLTRGEQVIETREAILANYISYTFTTPLLSGDIIEARTASTPLYHTVVSPLAGTMDVETNQITGQADPGRAVFINIEPYNGGALRFTHCSADTSLQCALAAADGSFLFDAPLDLRPGDLARVTQYDEQGYAQVRSLDTGSMIFVDQFDREIEAHLPGSQSALATAKVMDSQGSILWQEDSINSGESVFIWSIPIDSQLLPGQIIEVSDGTISHTMTIPEITLEPLHEQTQVSGHAPGGELFIIHIDSDLDGWSMDCVESNTQGGLFSIPVGSEPYIGIDEFPIVHHDGQGGYSNHFRVSRFLSLTKDAAFRINGSVELPGTQVTLTHQRGGDIIATYSAVSSSVGTFDVIQDAGLPFQQGDRLIVEAENGEFSMEVPELSASIDPLHYQVAGRAPGSRSVFATITRSYDAGPQPNKQFQVFPDAEGNFRADLPVLPESSSACAGSIPLSPEKNCIQVTLVSYTPEGNLIGWSGPPPAAVQADSFEPNDTLTAAKLYENQPQNHTLLSNSEVDWVKIEVKPLEVGRTFTIRLSDMGWKMPVHYQFSYNDSLVDRRSDTFIQGKNEQFQIIPTRAGAYYLRLQAVISGYIYGNCDSGFTLTIDRPQTWMLHLPLIENEGRVQP